MADINGGVWYIEPMAMIDNIIHPAVSDVLPPGVGAYDGVMQDFLFRDDVPYKRPIADIYKIGNVLRRQDASCDVIYKQVGSTALRYIETSELISATKNCNHAMYQGALRDFLAKRNETFSEKILPFFQRATTTDIYANAWFGDVARASTSMFNTNSYDGIVKWIQYYINAGTIAAVQTYAPAATDYTLPANYADAYNAIVNAYAKQTPLMRSLAGLNKVIYCDIPTLEGYRSYVRQLGVVANLEYIQVAWGNGMKQLDSYNGVPIVAVPMFELLLNDVLGAPAPGAGHHMVILTVRQNFIFGTDNTYGEEGGEGTDGNSKLQALVVWYRRIDRSWYYQQFLKAGTQIGAPELIVYGISA